MCLLSGRMKACLAFCVIYALSCATKLDKSLTFVLIGRFLGGISTSLFHSVFESWMVAAHNEAGISISFFQSFRFHSRSSCRITGKYICLVYFFKWIDSYFCWVLNVPDLTIP